MLNDLRFAFRMINTHRWFSAAVAVTLALGIGINSTVFTLVDAVLFKPVPVPGGERLVTVSLRNVTKPNERSGLSLPDLREYRAHNRSFDGLEASSGGQATLSEAGNPPERYRMARVTSGLFPLVGTSPILGRGISVEHEKPGGEGVVLLGHRVWQARYGGSLDVIGRAVRVNGQAATIIGVMPAGFRFPQDEDFWLPLVRSPELERRNNLSLQGYAMRKPGVSLAAAQADLAVIGQRLAREFPETNKDVGPWVLTFHDAFNGGSIRAVFLTMLVAVAFVLLIACANVANMMLSRALARAREISVRVAMGASRWQIVRQLLVESVLLSCLGGLLGLGLALLGVHLFDLATQDVGKPYWIVFEMDWRSFVYFAAISVLSGIVFGLVPAWRASRVDLNTVLKDGTPGGGSARAGKFTAALVVLQFALTVILLAGAGLMVRSFFAAQTINPFVPADRILTARIELPSRAEQRYSDPDARRQFWEKLLPDLTALPGVTHAAITSNGPGLGGPARPIEIEGRPTNAPETPPRATYVLQSPAYLSVIGLPLLQGRGFTDSDGEPGREVAVVTREFAALHWPGSSALGQRLRFVADPKKPGAWMTIVGVSADIAQTVRSRSEAPPPVMHVPYRQEPGSGMLVMLRTGAAPGGLSGPLRSAVQRLDPDLPLFDVRTVTAALERQRWFLPVFGTLFAVFAATALLMASVGIYAVVAQSTVRRTREIGIRMALGSTAGGILRLVLSRGLVQLGLGLGLGLAGAVASTRVLQTTDFLIETSPTDPLVFAVSTLLLAGIGLFACWLPARRAARIMPTKALRME
jgi:predicted permease